MISLQPEHGYDVEPTTQREPARLFVEHVHKVSRRPWIFVTGRLEGGTLALGDTVSISAGDHVGSQTVVQSVELHGQTGKITVAIDADFESVVRASAVIRRF